MDDHFKNSMDSFSVACTAAYYVCSFIFTILVALPGAKQQVAQTVLFVASLGAFANAIVNNDGQNFEGNWFTVGE